MQTRPLQKKNGQGENCLSRLIILAAQLTLQIYQNLHNINVSLSLNELKQRKARKFLMDPTSFQIVAFVALLFYVHGKHLRSCRDGQLA